MKKAKLITSSAVVMTMVMSSIVPAFAYSKEETVYSKLKTNGSEKTTVVSEHLINDQNETSLDDQSSLKNIKNVNGKETFKQDGSSLVWQTTDGQDIYYQGKTTNSLPVSMKVTYKLDGKKTKLKDMLGKKGKETFKQDGSSLVWQTTDGQDIYYQGKTTNSLPVSMKVTYKLDGKKTKLKDMLGKKGKVEIQIDYTNNEKQTVDGKELYVPFVVTTGTMLPTKTNSNIEVTNGKVISNGSSNIIMAIAAPGLSKSYDNNKDLEKLNSVTIKYDTTKFKLNSLMSVATPSLLSETDINFDDLNDVYDSVDTLNSSFDQIIAGGQTLQSGLKQYASKYSEFDQGVGSLKTGAASALVGSQKLTTGIETLYNGLITLDGQSATLVGGAKQVFNTLLTTTQTQINNQLAATGMSIELTIDNYQTVLNGLMAKLPAENQPSIKTALAQLDSYNKFYQGLQSYTDGVAQLKEGAKSAVDGSKQLSEGLSSLSDGSNTLVQASSQLKTASNQLAQGSDALVDGLTLFKSKGLDKISSVLNDTVKKDVDTTQELVDLANDYKTFADSKDGVEAKTKFIMIIDSKSKK